MLEVIMGETKMFDTKETQGPQSTDTIIYENAQEEIRDEVQQGGGNVLGTNYTIAFEGEMGGDGDDDDDDKDSKKNKDSSPMDKTPTKEKHLEEDEEEVEIKASNQKKIEEHA